MAESDPFRAEVALNLGRDERIILRCSFSALTRMLPLLEASPEVAARRHERLAVNQRAFGREVPPLGEWNWNQHLLGAVAAGEVEVVARCIAVLAQEHHPDLTFERVMEASPGWAQIAPVFSQLVYLHHFKPGEEPAGGDADAPFGAMARLSDVLSRLLSRTGSHQQSSGG